MIVSRVYRSVDRSIARSLNRSVDRSLGRSVARSLARSVLAGRFIGTKINRRLGLAGGGDAKCKKINKTFLPDCVWGLSFVGFKSKIRPRGTKSEAAAVIMNRGHKKNQATSVSSGYCPRGGWLFARVLQFSMLAGSGKRIKKKKHSLSFSPIPTKHQTGVRIKWFPSMYAAAWGHLCRKTGGFLMKVAGRRRRRHSLAT